MGSPDVEAGESPREVAVKFAEDVAPASPSGLPGTKQNKHAGKQLSSKFLSTGLPVAFKGLTYTVVNRLDKRERIPLLAGVTGCLLPGEMSALMGPSGSGKTTLLDILAGRKTVGALEGELRYGGEKASSMFLRRFTGYVEQFDTLLDILTVSEMLMYTAELKRPISQGREEKQAAVEELLHVLALDSCRDTRIGSAMRRGISGGQRVNIGIALITNPKVLYLDEPTSGLDSYTANEVMTVVKSLARMGITVCATIHSPTPYCFNLFDRLLMLLRGRTIYFGPNGMSAYRFFQDSHPQVEGLREGENPAEWIVDLSTQGDRQGRAPEFAAAFEQSPLAGEADAQVTKLLSAHTLELDEATKRSLAVTKATVTPSWWALKVLFQYRTLKNYRNPEFLGPRVADKLIFSIIIFTLYWKVGWDLSPTNIPNIGAVLFMWCTLPAYGASSYVPSLVLERPLFVRERNDGLYRVGTYLASKMVEEVGLALVNSLVFSNIVFWPLKLQGQYALFWLIYLVTLSIGISSGYFVAAISPNMDVANAALPSYTTTLLFFSGFLIPWNNIPKWWQWYGYIDFLRYAWGALTANQFGGGPPPAGRDVPFLQTNPPEPAMSVLEYYSLSGISMWGWLGIEFAFFVAFTLLTYIALACLTHVKR